MVGQPLPVRSAHRVSAVSTEGGVALRRIGVLGAAGTAVMVGALLFGFSHGDLWVEGRALTDMPWGLVSLVDVYVGLALFCAWVIFRERERWKALVWVGLALVLGNLVAALYVAIVARRCGADMDQFWQGER